MTGLKISRARSGQKLHPRGPRKTVFYHLLLTQKQIHEKIFFQLYETSIYQPRIFTGRTDAEAGTLTLWPPDAKSWLIGDDSDAGKDWRQRSMGRGRDGWMASLTQWTWVWANSRRRWRTGKPGVLQFIGSQRVGHDLVTGQQQVSV